jgi:hypothetical protein
LLSNAFLFVFKFGFDAFSVVKASGCRIIYLSSELRRVLLQHSLCAGDKTAPRCVLFHCDKKSKMVGWSSRCVDCDAHHFGGSHCDADCLCVILKWIEQFVPADASLGFFLSVLLTYR